MSEDLNLVTVSHNGKEQQIRIVIDNGMWGVQNTLAYWEVGNTIAAAALAQTINEHIENRMEMIHRDAYMAGWKDAKSKKTPKRTWFRYGFDRLPLEYNESAE